MRKIYIKSLGIFFGVAIISLLFGVTLVLKPIVAAAEAKTIVIDSTADQPDSTPGDGACRTAAGGCTLRAAIQEANANNNPSEQDTISFAGLSEGVKTITPNSALPFITQKVIINGYTKQDAKPNTSGFPEPFNASVTVEIDGQKAGGVKGLVVEADDVLLQGLSLINYSNPATAACVVHFGGSTSNGSVKGMYIGVMADGARVSKGAIYGAVCVDKTASGITIGGPQPGDRNILANNGEGLAAIQLNGSKNQVQGNYIGMAKNGEQDLNGKGGILIQGNNNSVGGAGTRGNLVSGGEVHQIVIASQSNVIQGNRIGTNYRAEASQNISNGLGVHLINNATSNLIGGINAQQSNTIRGVTGAGVLVSELYTVATNSSQTPQKNAILGNIITDISVASYPGVVDLNMGIELLKYTDSSMPPDTLPDTASLDGGKVNDQSDSDEGPNRLINKPVLKSVQQDNDTLTIVLELDAASSPIEQYRIEFFANDKNHTSGQGLAQTFLGASVTTTGKNQQIILKLPDSKPLLGKYITATTTAIDSEIGATGGYGPTSEFAQNITVSLPRSNSLGKDITLDRQQLIIVGFIAGGLLLLVAYLYRDYRKHRHPLLAMDPMIRYSFIHHLRVVTFPLLRYRLHSFFHRH